MSETIATQSEMLTTKMGEALDSDALSPADEFKDGEDLIAEVPTDEQHIEIAIIVDDEPKADDILLAVVKECKGLNLREQPDTKAAVLTVLADGTEVMVDQAESTEEFYKVCNAAGIEGYCMKKFLEVLPG